MAEPISIINELYLSNSKFYGIFEGIKENIENVIEYIENQNENINPKNELKYIQFRIDKIMKEIEENKKKIKSLVGELFFNYKIQNIKLEPVKWSDHIQYRLINGLVFDDNKGIDYIKNILTHAAIFGSNGTLWAYSRSLNIKKNEIEKLNELFELKEK